jgi:hypothetical protein
MNRNIYRLEYSEEQQCFHYADRGDLIDDEVYPALAHNVPSKLANAFTYVCAKRYNEKQDNFPDFATMKREWELFNYAVEELKYWFNEPDHNEKPLTPSDINLLKPLR